LAKLIGALDNEDSGRDSFTLSFALYTLPFPSATNGLRSVSAFGVSIKLLNDKFPIWRQLLGNPIPACLAFYPFKDAG
jgi:hypothetical protein